MVDIKDNDDGGNEKKKLLPTGTNRIINAHKRTKRTSKLSLLLGGGGIDDEIRHFHRPN
jgi:hypothetical protein